MNKDEVDEMEKVKGLLIKDGYVVKKQSQGV